MYKGKSNISTVGRGSKSSLNRSNTKTNSRSIDRSGSSRLNRGNTKTNLAKLEVLELEEVEENVYVRKSASKISKVKKIKIFTVPKLLAMLFVCMLLVSLKLGGVFNQSKHTDYYISKTKRGSYFATNVAMDNEEAFKIAIRKYIKTEYGLNVVVSEVKSTKKEDKSSLEAVFKVDNDDLNYSFVYSKEGNVVEVSEDYGARYTGRLLSERLGILYKDKLPKNADIWVVTNSLSADEDISFSEVKGIISKWDIGDIVSYNKSNHLIKEINIGILSGGESNLNKYANRIIGVVSTLDSGKEGMPKLNVGFYKGKKSRDYVYEDVAKRRGIGKEDIDFSIDWYEEIPKITNVKSYMWGAISISKNASKMLNSYIEDKVGYYVDYYNSNGGDKEVIYKKVRDLVK